MDQLPKTNTRQAIVKPTWVEGRQHLFLAHMYPEHLLLPENQTIKMLFHTLYAKCYYKGGKWIEYPMVHYGQNSDHKNNLAKFLNGSS